MSGHVGSAISSSGTVECDGSRWNLVAISFRSLSTSGFHCPFPLSDPWPTLRVRNVGRCRTVSAVPFPSRSIVENVVIAVGIVSPSPSIQMLFPLPVSTFGFVADILVPEVGRCRAVSVVPYLGRARSKMWGLPLESFRHPFAFKSIPLPVPWPTLRVSNVGRCRQCNF